MKEIGTFKIDKNKCSNCSEDENCPQKYSVNGNCLYIEKDLVIEQVPESFADLLTLCKNLKEVDIDTDEDYMSISVPKADLIYFEDEILMVAGFQKLEIKPAQMWQIIKNLIGEE